MNRIIGLIYVIILIFTFGLSCCKSERSAYNKMDVAESIINSRPDIALALLDSIQSKDITGKRTKARLALLRSMALDKNYVDTTTFDILQPAIDYYLKNGTSNEKLRTYYYQGRIYQNQGNYDAAMLSFMNALEFGPQVRDTLCLANVLVAQGTILYRNYKFNEFIINNLNAAQLYGKINRKDAEVSCILNALDGCIVNDNKIIADSLVSLLKTMSEDNPKLDSIIGPYIISYSLTFGSKDDIRMLLNKYQSIDSIDDDIKIDLAVAYFAIGDSNEAKRFLESIDLSSSITHSLKYLSIKPEILEQTGDIKGALNAYQKLSNTIDSIHMGIFSHDLLFAKERHEIEKANLIEIQKKNRIIWLSIGIILVSLIVTVLIYYRYRLGKTQRLLAIQENEKLKLESDANALKAENLEYQLQQLKEESVSLKNILNARQDLDQPVQNAIQIRLDMLNKLLATSIADNATYSKQYEEWRDQLLEHKEEFMNSTRLAYKATHPMFIDFLEKHGLSNDEINHACLYAIGLKGKDVGSYTKHSRYYHISSDIRKKLGIDEHQTNLGIYIRKLLKQL